MCVSVSITVKPLGFGGAVKDRRIIVFVKKLRNKDQEPHRQKLVREMTTETEGKKKGGVCECVHVHVHASVTSYTRDHMCQCMCTPYIALFPLSLSSMAQQ